MQATCVLSPPMYICYENVSRRGAYHTTVRKPHILHITHQLLGLWGAIRIDRIVSLSLQAAFVGDLLVYIIKVFKQDRPDPCYTYAIQKYFGFANFR